MFISGLEAKEGDGYKLLVDPPLFNVRESRLIRIEKGTEHEKSYKLYRALLNT